MLFESTSLEGVWLIRPERRHDERGWFTRSWCEMEFAAHGLNTRWPQGNVTRTLRRGMIRGLHWQDAQAPEIKLVRCSAGAIQDVVVDVRHDSPTRGRWLSFELSAENGHQLYVGAGFAHGFQCLGDGSEVSYLMGGLYVSELARGFRWDDPEVAIAWKDPAAAFLSERDRNLPLLRDVV